MVVVDLDLASEAGIKWSNICENKDLKEFESELEFGIFCENFYEFKIYVRFFEDI